MKKLTNYLNNLIILPIFLLFVGVSLTFATIFNQGDVYLNAFAEAIIDKENPPSNEPLRFYFLILGALYWASIIIEILK